MSMRLAIFDFDYTLTDDDSHSIFSSFLNGGFKFDRSRPWIDQVADNLSYLQTEHNVRKLGIAQELQKLKFIDGIDDLLGSLHAAKNIKTIILSNSNDFFVQTALKAKQLDSYFDFIFTNATEIDDDDFLRVVPHKEMAERAQLGTCPIQKCPYNLCKGTEIMRLLEEYENPEIWYCGDGWNDWCAAFSLPSANHCVFARKGFPLSTLVNQRQGELKCSVKYWDNGYDLLYQMKEIDSRM